MQTPLAYMLLVCLLVVATPESYQQVNASERIEFPSEQIEFFERKIRPVLVERCYECHSEDSQSSKGGLRLDHRQAILVGGDSGPSVDLSQPGESLLLKALKYESYQMPPSGILPEPIIQDFKKWIELGLPDPRVEVAKSSPHRPEQKTSELWSLQPISRVTPPSLENASWPLQDLDHFVLKRLEEENLSPIEDADPERLLRRLFFVIIGLPPTPEDIDQFLRDYASNPNSAVESVVDRLLASNHYGERWGRHWLDVARYAESNGMAWNMSLPFAWRYRDYVIASFNKDKPFDQFISEQIAGDLLPADSRAQRRELLTATGFLALGPKPFYEKEAEIEQNRADWVDEQIDVIGKGLLGLTVSCARCHDHKFDPIPTGDYYAMAGIFFGTEILSGPKVGKPAAWKKSQLHEDSVHVLSSEDLVATAQHAQKSLDDMEAKLKQIEKNKKKHAQEIAELKESIRKLKDRSPELEYAFGVADRPPFGPTNIRIRGEWNNLGEKVPRGFLSAVSLGDHETSGPNDSSSKSSTHFDIPNEQSGRLQLSQWITHHRNPLTPRVIVNRIWQHLLGRGIVSTVDNFGASGAPPSHPELLDFLAYRFIHVHDWSIKRMIREIVLSRTFRLASRNDEGNYQSDPENQLLWRAQPNRLEAEAIRDSLLFISGQLDLQPLEGSHLSELNYRLLTPNDVGHIHSSSQKHHRSVYLAVLRGQDTDELLSVFDFPDPGTVKGSRETTTVPSQALYMMNSPLTLDAAEAVANTLLDRAEQRDSRIDLAFKMTLGRSPTKQEIRRSQDGLDSFTGSLLEKWTAFAHSLMLSTEFRYLY